MMPRMTLRLRMILLFCAVVGVFLAGIYLVVYSMFNTGLRKTRFERLFDRASPLIALLHYPGGAKAMESFHLHMQYFEVYDARGNVLYRSNTLGKRDLPAGSFAHTAEFRTVDSVLGSIREVIVPVVVDGRPAWFAVAEQTSTIHQIEEGFRFKFLVIWLASILLTALLATWYVARALEPITLLTRHAEELTERIAGTGYEPAPHLPVRNPHDEVGRLARNFNVLFERVDSLVRQMRLFVSDAAHELRTPLAVLHGETQFLLSHRRSVEEYQKTLVVIDDELSIMSKIVEGLFTLSMADAGQLHIQREQLFLDEVLEEACGIAAPLARQKHIAIEKQQWQEQEFHGDQTLLRQLFLILLENAIKYSSPGTKISVRLAISNGRPSVTIADQGMGIAAEHLQHIFERFYRAAPQTSDESRSGGLGLAIADAIVKAHAGSIVCESTVGAGSHFTVILPSVTDTLQAVRAHSAGRLPE